MKQDNADGRKDLQTIRATVLLMANQTISMHVISQNDNQQNINEAYIMYATHLTRTSRQWNNKMATI